MSRPPQRRVSSLSGLSQMSLSNRKRNRSRSRLLFSASGNGHIPHTIELSQNILLWLLLKRELAMDTGAGAVLSRKVALESYDKSMEELLNMVQVPFYLEKFMAFGLLVSFCSYLTVFTLVPLKVCLQTVRVMWHMMKTATSRRTAKRCESENIDAPCLPRRDIISLSIIGCALSMLLGVFRLDISRMYHDIRGQAHIKLYVMFGVLEVADKLLLSLGQDLLGLLYKSTRGALMKLKFVGLFLVGVMYLLFHGYVLVYQTVSLNVAANSYSNALLTLLLSNQFAELKGSVFKRFEKEGLFQVALADLCERYLLGLMISIIATRNLLQVTQMGGVGSLEAMGSLIPNSWSAAWNSLAGGAIIGPAIVVFGSEIIVDWLKHCYIVKFNKFRPAVYKNYAYVLSLDFLEATTTDVGHNHNLTDYVVLMRRIGIPLFASVVCSLAMTINDVKFLLLPIPGVSMYAVFANAIVVGLVFLALVFIRLILGLVVLKMAHNLKNDHIRHQRLLSLKQVSPIDADYVAGAPNPETSVVNPLTRKFLYDFGEVVPPDLEEKRNSIIIKKQEKREDSLDNVLRFEMSSKRIW